VVQRLDAPVAASLVVQAGGVGPGGGEVGDRIHGHDAPAPVCRDRARWVIHRARVACEKSRPATVVTWTGGPDPEAPRVPYWSWNTRFPPPSTKL
jgi:hypothetical protein